MKFLRENVFLVALVGAIVFVGGGMLSLGFSVSGSNDDLVEQRTKISDNLKGLDGPRVKANRNILKATEKHRTRVKIAAEAVIKTDSEWNRQRYTVMKVSYLAENVDIVADIFPMDRELYEEYPVISQVPKLYQRQLEELVQSLSPVELPTDVEIAHEQTRFQRWLYLQKKAEEPNDTLAAPGRTPVFRRGAPARRGRFAGRGDIGSGRGGIPDDMMGRGRGSGPGMGRGGGPGMGRGGMLARGAGARAGGAGAGLTAEALEMGLRYMRMKKARTGKIYADISAFDMAMLPNAYNPSNEEIWAAQINLWVTRDIVAAIVKTNDAKLSQLDSDKRNVVNAPIKRLLRIEVSENYYTGGAVTKALKGGPSRRTSGRGGGPGMGRGGGPGMGRGGGPGMGRGGGPGSSARMSAGGATGDPLTLTKRVCNSEYDVVHYSFSVIMPTGDLPDLQRQLLELNHHTILSMSIDQAGTSVVARTGVRGGGNTTDSLFYYGTDPVLEVTLYGELLLLTSWERGTWDDDKEQWSLPPLMPDEVLASIEGRTEDAMRDEDEMRLSEAGLSDGGW